MRLIYSYLTNRKQRTKVSLSYSPWEEILFGVPQRSILERLLFNIFLCDLFFIMNETDFASYADDNTPYRIANTIDEVIQSLEHDSMMLFQWFSDNQTKANKSKCHLLVNKKDEVTIRIGDTEIKNSEYEKLVSSFFNSQFNYCPLIWMFHSRIIRCLRLLYGEKSPSFGKLLEQDKTITIHTTQPAITCSKLTIETLEQGVKYVQS